MMSEVFKLLLPFYEKARDFKVSVCVNVLYQEHMSCRRWPISTAECVVGIGLASL